MRITKERRSIFFRTPYISETKKWDSKQGKFNDKASDYLNKNRFLLKFQDRATTIITQLEQEKTYYTLDDVEKALRIDTNPKNNLIYPFWEEIRDYSRTEIGWKKRKCTNSLGGRYFN